MSLKNISIKSILLICFLMTGSILFSNCKKDGGQGLIQFTVVYDGRPITNAIIHITDGTLTDPGILPDQYQRHIGADGLGEYWCKDLNPGDYFFYATAKVNGVPIGGTASLQVKERYRHNTYKVVILMQ
jgi:hypothetical protein